MSERPENFNAAGADPDATLASPRFDADDARRAHPVVPLADAPRRVSHARARAPRRAWKPALLAVALLAVAAVGGAVVTMLMQSPSTQRVQEQVPEQEQQQTQSAPPQTAEAPPRPAPPVTAEAPRENVTAAQPAPRDTRSRGARAAAPAPVEYARDDHYEDEDHDRRGRKAEKRRGRDDDEVEKEMRKASKRGRGKAARLVDVLTNP